MIKVSIEGLPGEIAALIEAIQEQQRVRGLRHKRFGDLTTEDFARLNEANELEQPTVTIRASTNLQG